MSSTVFFAILGAALLHATWNALIKVGGSKMNAMLVMTVVQGAAGALVATTQPIPSSEVWIWLLASGAIHSTYKLLLSFAYEQGDLSRVYPIARGAAPMMVLMVGAVVLNDEIRGREMFGICLLGLGILMMARGVFSNGESRRLIPFALGSAIATASYSLVDGIGARLLGDPVAFVAWMFVVDAFVFTPVAVALRGRAVLKSTRRSWGIGALAAMASYASYAVAVWAMTKAPIALVTALRETSILFAILIGWLIFKEPMDRGKALAAALIIGGVISTRL